VSQGAKLKLPPESELRIEPDSAHRVTTDGFAAGAAELLAFLADSSPQEVVDEFIAVVERLPLIILSPEEGKLRVDLHGEIAAILRLAKASKNPARDLAHSAEQLVMVAGTGFVQERTRWELRKTA
jgi:hypothetical protein